MAGALGERVGVDSLLPLSWVTEGRYGFTGDACDAPWLCQPIAARPTNITCATRRSNELEPGMVAGHAPCTCRSLGLVECGLI
jgi:hypothetical protein